ncbi:MAG: hypothetical protein AAGI66_04645 [Cyanobacteria bacterium P01_H01_bin.74]
MTASALSSDFSRSFTDPSFIAPGFAERHFLLALEKNRLAHAYVLKGTSVSTQYKLVSDLAKALFCLNRPPSFSAETTGWLSELACGQCKSCTWLSSNSHPDFITVSRMSTLVDDNTVKPMLLSAEALTKLAEKNAWPKQIKTAQINYVIQKLALSSTTPRVVVFTDSEILSTQPELNQEICPPSEWLQLPASQHNQFIFKPLTAGVFHPNAINRFLKTLEEPPANVLIVFLVGHEDNLMNTIVSRCQVVTVNATASQELAFHQALPAETVVFLSRFFEDLGKGQDVFDAYNQLDAYFKETTPLSWQQALAQCQIFWHQALQNNITLASFNQIRQLQTIVQNAQARLHSKTHETAVLLDFLLTTQALLSA